MAENVVEQIEQGNWLQTSGDQPIGRFKQPAMVAAAGIGAALVIMTLPHVYLENIIVATGLAEFVPAASPPLGSTARGLIAVMACLVSASAIYYFLNRKGGSEMSVALREKINSANSDDRDQRDTGIAKKIRFGWPKIDTSSWTRFLKKPKKDKARIMDLADLPKLRITESDDEIPQRASIFAATEEVAVAPLTGNVEPFEDIAPFEENRDETRSAEIMSTPTMELPVDETVDEPIVEEVVTKVTLANNLADDEAQTDDLADLTIAQLADRLESGLNRLKQLEAANAATSGMATSLPVETPVNEAAVIPSPPVQQRAEPQEGVVKSAVDEMGDDRTTARHADMDAALKAALGTLEKMTTQR